MQTYINKITHTHIIVLLTFIISVIYLQGIGGGFVFDDIHNIVANKAVHIESLSLTDLKNAALSSESGPFKRPVGMISFALNYYFSGLNAETFKFTNIIIHLICCFLIYVLSVNLLWHIDCNLKVKISPSSRQLISLLVALAWGVYPLNLASVLYIVPSMTSLAAMFSLSAILFYVIGRKRHALGVGGGWWLIFCSMTVFLPLSIFSKESGVLTTLLIGVIECTLLRFRGAKVKNANLVKLFFFLTCIAPCLVAVIYIIVNPEFVTGGYALREFTFDQRFFTEMRVLVLYLKLALVPVLSEFTLFHDDINISTGLFFSLSTFAAFLTLVISLVFAFIIKKKQPVIAFAIFFFLVGHSLESTIFSLEIAHEHRNYLPLFGVMFCVMYYLVVPCAQVNWRLLSIKKLFAILFIVILGGVTVIRASVWSSSDVHAFTMVKNHPDSIRSNHEAARILYILMLKESEEVKKQEYEGKIRSLFYRNIKNDPNNIGAALGLLQLNSERNKEPPPELMSKLYQNLMNGKPTPFVISYVVELNRCELNGDCKILHRHLDEILKSLLVNQLLSPPKRSILIAELASRYLNYGDVNSALQLLQMAIENFPSEIQHWLNYAKLLVDIGRIDLAQVTIDQASIRFSSESDLSRVSLIQNEILAKQRLN